MEPGSPGLFLTIRVFTTSSIKCTFPRYWVSTWARHPLTRSSLSSTSTTVNEQLPRVPWIAPAKSCLQWASSLPLLPFPPELLYTPKLPSPRLPTTPRRRLSASHFSNHQRCLRKRPSCSCPAGLHWLSGPRKDPLPDDVRSLTWSQTTLLQHPALSRCTLSAFTASAPASPPRCRTLPGGPFTAVSPEGGRGWDPENICRVNKHCTLWNWVRRLQLYNRGQRARGGYVRLWAGSQQRFTCCHLGLQQLPHHGSATWDHSVRDRTSVRTHCGHAASCPRLWSPWGRAW